MAEKSNECKIRTRHSITMESNLRKRLVAEAARTKRTISALIEVALEEYLDGGKNEERRES